MGVFDFWKGSSSPEAKRAEEVRSGARAPDRTERKRCWEARDGYFACLDRAGVLDAIKDDAAAAKACRAEGAQFERDCAAEWVSLLACLLAVFALLGVGRKGGGSGCDD